jgi:hypothetical protein
MTAFVTDTFSGTDGTELSAYDASWSQATGSLAASQLASGRVRISAIATGMGSAYLHSATPPSADYSVSVDILDASSGTAGQTYLAGPLGRGNGGANTFYHAHYNNTSTVRQWRLWKCVSGVFTQLGSSVSQTLTVGSTYNCRLTMSGTTISLTKENEATPIISVTDSAISTTGKAGLRVAAGTTPGDATLLQLDNFVGADLAGGSPTTVTVTVGSLAMTAQALVVNAKTMLAVTKASLGFTGQALQVAGSTIITITKATLGVTANALVVNAKVMLQVAASTLGFTGRSFTTNQDAAPVPSDNSRLSHMRRFIGRR